jgi:hypothetical protein
MAARARSGRDEAQARSGASMSGDWHGGAGEAAVYALLAQHGEVVTGAISWAVAGVGQCVLAVSGKVKGVSFRLSGKCKSGATAPQRCPDDSVFTGKIRGQEIAVETSPWGRFTLHPVDALRALAERGKELLEAKRWTELGELLTLREVWAFDRALPVAEALRRLAAILDAAEDIHLWVERVLAAETAAASGHLSLACCLMWGEAASFADHERELDLHLGFRRGGDGAWSIDYLGVTASRPAAAAAAAAGTAPARLRRVAAAPGPETGQESEPGQGPETGPGPGQRPAPGPGPAPGGLVLDGGAEPVPPGYVRVLLPALVPAAAWSGTVAAPELPPVRKQRAKRPR